MEVMALTSGPLHGHIRELLTPRTVVRPKLIVIALLAACNAAGQTIDPSAALEQAKSALGRGDFDSALAVVRTMRIQVPGSKELPEALLVAARAALASEPYRARFFVDSALAHQHTTEALRFEIAVTSAEIWRQDRYLTKAVEELQEVLRVPSAQVEVTRIDQVRLQAAELVFYELGDRATAAYLALQIVNPSALDPSEQRAYGRLVNSVLWSRLTPDVLGLPDANVSAIAIDGDDVWIGTFNGGAARYSQSTGITSRFTPATSNWQLAETIRSIEVDGNWVWFGTFEGLSVYSKATSRIWRVAKFGAPGAKRGDPPPLSIVALEEIDGGIAVSAIGAGGDARGLWFAEDPDGEWTRVQDGNLPGRRVTALARAGGTLYIGTEDRGVVVMDLKSGRVHRAAAPWTAGAVNVQALTVDEEEMVWIGTYGTGIYRWDPTTNEISQYSTSSGTMADDYVLSAATMAGSVVFGTFGAGAYHYSVSDDKWTAIDLESGLMALEITAIANAGAYTYFGTLGSGVAVLASSLEHAARAASY